MVSRRTLAGVLLLAAACANVRAASAQTSADLFNDQALQRIDLYVNTRDWHWLRARYLTNDYYPANMKWNGTTVPNVGIRIRGAGSRSPSKPALRVDFNRYAAGRTFLGLTSIALNNGAQDPSGLRELLTLKVYAALGVPAPRIAPAALYVNNEYLGLYSVIEEVDEAFLSRVFGERDGHLFEYRWTFYYYFEYLGSALEPYAGLYEPKTRATESAATLYRPVEAMLRAVNEAFDEDFASAVSAYTDLPAFMRLVAAQAAMGECDGLLGSWAVSNHFLYRLTGRTVHRFVPWDASSSICYMDYPLHAGHAENVLMRRAMAVPSLEAVYHDALVEAADLFDRVDGPPAPEQPSPGWLEREAVRLLGLIRDAAYADRAKPYSNAEFDAAAEQVLAFTRSRSSFIRREVWRFGPGAGPVY